MSIPSIETPLLRVNEVFGPTLQGEGSACGRHCLFLRLFDCNLTCNWCDTPQTWAVTDNKAAKHQTGIKHNKAVEMKELTTDQVMDQLLQLWPLGIRRTMLVISGGEPMLQQNGLFPLLVRLRGLSVPVHIETAGTLPPSQDTIAFVDQFNVSPKLAHSGNELSKRFRPRALQQLNESGKAWWKFVITEPTLHDDLQEIDAMVRQINIPTNRVMVMPEGHDLAQHVRVAQLAEKAVLTRGYGLTFRTHTMIWGEKRGH